MGNLSTAKLESNLYAQKDIHIHGNADRILPLPNTGVTHIVKMVVIL